MNNYSLKKIAGYVLMLLGAYIMAVTIRVLSPTSIYTNAGSFIKSLGLSNTPLVMFIVGILVMIGGYTLANGIQSLKKVIFRNDKKNEFVG